MTLMVVLGCLVLQRFFGACSELREVDCLRVYIRCWQWLQRKCMHLRLGAQTIGVKDATKEEGSSLSASHPQRLSTISYLLLLCVPLLVILYAIQHLIVGLLGDAGYFLWSLLCLWLCMYAYNPRWHNTGTILKSTRSQHEEQPTEAMAAQSVTTEPFKHASSFNSSAESSSCSSCSSEGLFELAFARFFMLLFVFSLCGPLAVLIYRSLCLLSEKRLTLTTRDDRQRLAIYTMLADIRMLLEWIPSRLLGLSYAMMGRFGPSFELFWQQFTSLRHGQAQLAATWGNACLDYAQQDAQTSVVQAQAIINRCAILWLSVLAVFSLIA